MSNSPADVPQNTHARTGDPLSGGSSQDSGSSIQVAIRCRPFNARELESSEGTSPVLECSKTAVRVVGDGGTPSRLFGFDHCFGPDETQTAVFAGLGEPLLNNAMNAYNGCIFAYGQTGAGKSHSVVGDIHSDNEQGLLPRTLSRLFELLDKRRSSENGFEPNVLACYLEIYNEKVFDLISGDRQTKGELQIRVHPVLGPIVVGLTECPVKNATETLNLLDFGAKKRAVGATQMNATSSRSHAVFTVQIRMSRTTPKGLVESQSKLHFVDLAGSERQKKTAATGDRLKEGIGINQSLATLGRVISDLTKAGNKTMPPFRDSKLTMLLKDALNGNSRTALLACISPSKFNQEETVGTLEFASRCKMVKTVATKNEKSKFDVIAGLQNEKAMIEAQLQAEREQSEQLLTQLQMELAKALEKNKAADDAVKERTEIESKLRELEAKLASRRGCAKSDNDQSKSSSAKKKKITRASMKPQESPSSEAPQVSRNSTLVRAESPSSQKMPPVGALVTVSVQESEVYGTIRYAGPVAFTKGSILGVELIEEKGKNDGSVQNERYFTCPAMYGLFARPNLVTVQNDIPGNYVVTRQALVTEDPELQSAKVCELAVGDAVYVSEVVMLKGTQYIRGRVDQPRGWTTLLDVNSNSRFASREGIEMLEQAGALGEDLELEMKLLQDKLKELDHQEKLRNEQNSRESDLRAALQKERMSKQAREDEYRIQMDALRTVQESLALDQTQMDAKREELQKQREAELSKLGMNVSGVDSKDMATTPKLVNMHPDPALKGCLVYYLPIGETKIGSDAANCRIALSGVGVSAIVCTIQNTDGELLSIIPTQGALVRVNGQMASEVGATLSDGDRLAIGRAHIFTVRVPKAARDENFVDSAEIAFDKAMAEISSCAEIDPEWENGVQKAMMLVKTDYGTDAANQLLKNARLASEACAMANGVLQTMPEGLTDGVVRFELAVLFDSNGLPEVCIVARRREAEMFAEVESKWRRGGASAGIWQVEYFWKERIPYLHDAFEEHCLAEANASKSDDLVRWERHVWSDVAISDVKLLAAEVQSLKEKLADAEAALDAACQQDSKKSRVNVFFDAMYQAAGRANEMGSHVKRTFMQSLTSSPSKISLMSRQDLVEGSHHVGNVTRSKSSTSIRGFSLTRSLRTPAGSKPDKAR